MSKNIINFNSIFSLTDYEKMKLEEQYNRLYEKGRKEAEVETMKKEKERFYNLSLKQIVINMFNNLVDILNDLVNFINSDNKSYNRLIDIFTYKDRLIYFGIFLLMLAVMLFFIGATN